jgi:hypothetical protein
MMNSEQRLDRLERILMLMVRSGARVRREQNEKINIIIDAQIANEDRFATLAEDLNRSHDELTERIGQSHNELTERIGQSHNELTERIGQSHDELSQLLAELAQAQIRTETRLDSLIEAINRDRNGNSG